MLRRIAARKQVSFSATTEAVPPNPQVRFRPRREPMLPPRRCLPKAARQRAQIRGSRRLIGEAEHFWQKRYCDFNVRNEPQFVEKLSNSVIPNGTDHRKAMICGVEEPCVVASPCCDVARPYTSHCHFERSRETCCSARTGGAGPPLSLRVVRAGCAVLVPAFFAGTGRGFRLRLHPVRGRSNSPPCRRKRDKDGALSRVKIMDKGWASPARVLINNSDRVNLDQVAGGQRRYTDHHVRRLMLAE
jgi:hypothetical protein